METAITIAFQNNGKALPMRLTADILNLKIISATLLPMGMTILPYAVVRIAAVERERMILSSVKRHICELQTSIQVKMVRLYLIQAWV